MRRTERELVEVVLDRLDLAVVADLVAEAEERVLDLAPHLRDRVQLAERQLLARQRDVDDLLRRRRSSSSRSSASLALLRPPPRAARGSPFRSMPLSRSRTPRSACASSLLRPR